MSLSSHLAQSLIKIFPLRLLIFKSHNHTRQLRRFQFVCWIQVHSRPASPNQNKEMTSGRSIRFPFNCPNQTNHACVLSGQSLLANFLQSLRPHCRLFGHYFLLPLERVANTRLHSTCPRTRTYGWFPFCPPGGRSQIPGLSVIHLISHWLLNPSFFGHIFASLKHGSSYGSKGVPVSASRLRLLKLSFVLWFICVLHTSPNLSPSSNSQWLSYEPSP